MFHMSVSDILLLKPFMSNFGPAPSRITAKISPSVEPRSHLSSVRLDGCVPSGAIGPLPFASAPWQKRQFFWNNVWPALIDSGDEATGFFIFCASGLPPGFCAAIEIGINAVRMRTTGANTMTRETHRMLAELLDESGRCRLYAKAFAR